MELNGIRSRLKIGIRHIAGAAGFVLLAAMVPSAPSSIANAQGLEQKKAKTEAELEQLSKELQVSQTRKSEIEAELAALEQDLASINKQLIETTARSQALEVEADAAEVRLGELKRKERGIRLSLLSRKSLLAEVLAALQRIGRKPPPAILVKPEDALSSVRSAILLGAVVPEVRAETETLIAELTSLVRVRKDITKQRGELKISLVKLSEDNTRLSILLEEKSKKSTERTANLQEQREKAAELADKATSLQALILSLEGEIAEAVAATEAARLAEEERKRQEQQRIAEAREKIEKQRNNKNEERAPSKGFFSDNSRLAPAIAFKDAKGLLPKPVSGQEIVAFGSKNEVGVQSSGVLFETRGNAIVSSPIDGWVIYAGPFRSYGKLLILNGGDGYHVVLAHMDRINVSLGQFVLAGEPVGQMGVQRVASATTSGVGSTRPAIYVEFRHKGISIDPDPWWADKNTKRQSNDS